MAVRDPLYRETADLVVSTEKRSAAAVTKEIVRLLGSAGAATDRAVLGATGRSRLAASSAQGCAR